MFTERFIRVPIDIFSVRESEVMGKSTNIPSWLKFNPFELVAYRPTLSDDEEKGTVWTTIILKNGDEQVVRISTDEFEKLINNHFESINK